MRRLTLIAVLLVPAAALAQQPASPPSGPSTLASFLAANLSNALAESDALRAQVADLQKQLAEAKKTPEVPK